MKLHEIVERVGGELLGSGDLEIHSVGGLHEAVSGKSLRNAP
ncbi:MAG: hypothetical protein ACO3N7_06405 [Kiritimatiellia bacterium]